MAIQHSINNGHNYDRSCGYQWRPSIPIVEIERLCTHINIKYKHSDKKRDVIVFVDNCYGELVEDQEPGHVGMITLCVYYHPHLISFTIACAYRCRSGCRKSDQESGRHPGPLRRVHSWSPEPRRRSCRPSERAGCGGWGYT